MTKLPAPEPSEPEEVASAHEDTSGAQPPPGRPAPPSVAAKAAAASGARPAGSHSHAPPPPSARAAAAVHSTAAAVVSHGEASTPAVSSAASRNGAASNGAEPNTTSDVVRSNGKHEGLHVWVRTSARDPSLLLVRLLPDGHAAPPGAYEAYLQAVDEGVNLLVPKH